MHFHATTGGEGVGQTDAMSGEHDRRAVIPIPVADTETTETNVVLVILDALRERGGREVVGRRQLPGLTKRVTDNHAGIIPSHRQRKIADVEPARGDALLADDLTVDVDLHHRRNGNRG